MAGRRRSILALCLLTSCFVPTFSAIGSETVTYSYDERGRLIQVSRSGTVNNGVQSSYSYDNADNRTNVTVTGAGGAPPSFTIDDVSGSEGGNLVFTVTKTGSTSSSIDVNFTAAPGTATAGTDYYGGSGTITFSASETTKVITIGTIDDSAVEGAETVIVNLTGATGGVTIADPQGIGTINDNDTAAPSFSVNDVTVTESQPAVFTVTRSGTTTGTFSVNYATANGTAVAGTNYVSTTGTLAFASGEASKTVSVPTLNDGSIQPNKSFSLNLSAPTGGATLSDSSGTASVAEVGELILRSGQSIASPDGRFLLLMQTDGNLVLYGPDGFYWMTSTYFGGDRWMVMQGDGNLVVYNGANQALWHTGTHGNPGARLVLQNDGNLVIYSSTNAVLWHTNTPYQAPSFAIGDASTTEGGALTFTVTRSKATTATYSVNYATANGTAAVGSDYNSTLGTLTFAPTEMSRTVSVPTIDDAAVEGTEALTITLSSPTGGATISDAQGAGTINDNDTSEPPPEQCFDEGGRPIFCDPI